MSKIRSESFAFTLANITLYLLYMAVSYSFADASNGSYHTVKTLAIINHRTNPDYHATAYELKENDNDLFETISLPAKICFYKNSKIRRGICFKAKDGANLPYQEVKDFKIIAISNNKDSHGVLFTALHHGQTLGRVMFISIWHFDSTLHKFIDILPNVRLTYQSEYKISRNIDGKSIFITADRIWDENTESLYSPHRFKICILTLDDNNFFSITKSYTTENKYKSFDDVERIVVIEKEMETIRRILLN